VARYFGYGTAHAYAGHRLHRPHHHLHQGRGVARHPFPAGDADLNGRTLRDQSSCSPSVSPAPRSPYYRAPQDFRG